MIYSINEDKILSKSTVFDNSLSFTIYSLNSTSSSYSGLISLFSIKELNTLWVLRVFVVINDLHCLQSVVVLVLKYESLGPGSNTSPGTCWPAHQAALPSLLRWMIKGYLRMFWPYVPGKWIMSSKQMRGAPQPCATLQMPQLCLIWYLSQVFLHTLSISILCSSHLTPSNYLHFLYSSEYMSPLWCSGYCD